MLKLQVAGLKALSHTTGYSSDIHNSPDCISSRKCLQFCDTREMVHIHRSCGIGDSQYSRVRSTSSPCDVNLFINTRCLAGIAASRANILQSVSITVVRTRIHAKHCQSIPFLILGFWFFSGRGEGLAAAHYGIHAVTAPDIILVMTLVSPSNLKTPLKKPQPPKTTNMFRFTI